MERYHSIGNFIRCIEKLKTPYPEESLKKFLKGYVKSFTRESDRDHIYFDGEDVKIDRIQGQIQTNEEIENMLLGLLKYHKKGSSVHRQFLKAIEELCKTPVPAKQETSSIIEIDTAAPEQAFREALGEEIPMDDGDPPLPMVENMPMGETTIGYPFERIVLREPTMDRRNRWEIGISGAPGSLKEIRKFVERLPEVFPEIYMLKFLKKESSDRESCSKAEIYLETGELNIQKILDRLHDALSHKISKKIMPKDCSKRPRFMANIPAITGTSGAKGECIFTFSQGGEDTYEYKEELARNNDTTLNILFEGDSYYRFFGTLDVSIDIDGYNTTLYLVEETAKIMREIEDIDSAEMKKFLKDPPVKFAEVTKNYFTKLLYTNSVSVKSFRDLIYGGRSYQNVSFLHGIDSTHPIIFIMKPGFERGYGHSILPGLGAVRKGSVDTVKRDEASTFSFRYPKGAAREDKCSMNQTWCNTGLKVEGGVSFYDVDSILVPYYLEEEFREFNESLYLGQTPNPLYYRFIFYGSGVHKSKFLIRGDEAFPKGLSKIPDKRYYLSYGVFVDAQKEYMFRLAYHGLYKESMHKFK